MLAIAHAAGVELSLDDFEIIRARVPVLCDLKPSGRYAALPFLWRYSTSDENAPCMTYCMERLITGQTIAEVLADVPVEPRLTKM